MTRPGYYKFMGWTFIERRVLLLEAAPFLVLIALIWANELADLPYRFLGSPPTKVNIREALFESSWVLALGVLVIALTRKFLARIKYLEGFLVVCSFCKKIKTAEDTWLPIETFISDRAEVQFSHSLCPQCFEDHYGNFFRYRKKKPDDQV